MSQEIEVAELGINGRQAPDPIELKAILATLESLAPTTAGPAVAGRVPSWRFANRTWGKHAALLRTRPHRPNSF